MSEPEDSEPSPVSQPQSRQPPTAQDHDPPPRSAGIDWDNDAQTERFYARVEAWAERNAVYCRSINEQSVARLPVLSSLWGYDENYYRTSLADTVLTMTLASGRRLTDQERELWLRHHSKALVAESYDRPIAIGSTLFGIFRGWNTFDFPLYRPRQHVFDPDVFPSYNTTIFRGRIARLAWHGLRGGLYGAVGYAGYRILSPRFEEFFRRQAFANAFQWEDGLDQLHSDYRDQQDEHERITRG